MDIIKYHLHKYTNAGSNFMATLKKFFNLEDFVDQNSEKFAAQYFAHFHLHRLFNTIRNGDDTFNDAYNVVDDDGSYVIVIWIPELVFIYGEKWNADIISLLENDLRQRNLKDYLFRGQRELILLIMEKLDFSFEIINDRIIYDCNSVNKLEKPPKGKFGIATINDIPTIVRLSVDYYAEEFEGTGQQSVEAVQNSAYYGVKSSSTFKWSSNGRIVSIARTLGDNKENVMIGGLFTKPNQRNKGFAYVLISELTRHLLTNGAKKCGLLTESSKIATNKIFEKVGYSRAYRWINILVK